MSALMYACFYGHEEMAKLLLDSGADANASLPGTQVGAQCKRTQTQTDTSAQTQMHTHPPSFSEWLNNHDTTIADNGTDVCSHLRVHSRRGRTAAAWRGCPCPKQSRPHSNGHCCFHRSQMDMLRSREVERERERGVESSREREGERLRVCVCPCLQRKGQFNSAPIPCLRTPPPRSLSLTHTLALSPFLSRLLSHTHTHSGNAQCCEMLRKHLGVQEQQR